MEKERIRLDKVSGINATIKRIGSAEVTPMKLGRGITKHLAGPPEGAQRVDVHINVINEDSGIGPYHYHEKAENIYIVLDGVVEAIVDGKRYYLVKDDVAFIPPGVPHAAGSAGLGIATVLEIYAPAGTDFHIIDDPEEITDVERPEIVHLLPEIKRGS